MIYGKQWLFGRVQLKRLVSVIEKECFQFILCETWNDILGVEFSVIKINGELRKKHFEHTLKIVSSWLKIVFMYKNKECFTCRFCKIITISRWIILTMRNFTDRVVDKVKTRILRLIYFFFNYHTLRETFWKTRSRQADVPLFAIPCCIKKNSLCMPGS